MTPPAPSFRDCLLHVMDENMTDDEKREAERDARAIRVEAEQRYHSGPQSNAWIELHTPAPTPNASGETVDRPDGSCPNGRERVATARRRGTERSEASMWWVQFHQGRSTP